MSFVNNRISHILKYFKDTPEVQRIKELEPYIDNNKKINELFSLLKDKQKELVRAQNGNDICDLKKIKQEYNDIKQKLLDLPFLEEYLELVDYEHNILQQLASEIEIELQKSLK